MHHRSMRTFRLPAATTACPATCICPVHYAGGGPARTLKPLTASAHCCPLLPASLPSPSRCRTSATGCTGAPRRSATRPCTSGSALTGRAARPALTPSTPRHRARQSGEARRVAAALSLASLSCLLLRSHVQHLVQRSSAVQGLLPGTHRCTSCACLGSCWCCLPRPSV